MEQAIGKHFASGKWVSLKSDGMRISESTETSPTSSGEVEKWIMPMLVDLQVNGIAGREFIAPDMLPSEIDDLFRVLPSLGVSRFLPTLTTQDHDWLANSLMIMASAYKESPDLAEIAPGFHLEGPFISPEDGPRGAHPKDQCREPTWDEFELLQYRSGGRIRLLTMSPEYKGSAEFIKQVVETGVRVAIGHTNATTEQIQSAVEAGATLSTHLGNGAHARIKRHPNYIWDQLAEDRLMASLIADGHHLPAAVIKAFVRVKSPERLILVSDITGLSGVPAGEYVSHTLGPVEMLPNGKLVVAGQREYLAGASRPLFNGIERMINEGEVTISDAIAMATTRPAKLMDFQEYQLAPGEPANWLEVNVSEADGKTQFELDRIIFQGEAIQPNKLLHPTK